MNELDLSEQLKQLLKTRIPDLIVRHNFAQMFHESELRDLEVFANEWSKVKFLDTELEYDSKELFEDISSFVSFLKVHTTYKDDNILALKIACEYEQMTPPEDFDPTTFRLYSEKQQSYLDKFTEINEKARNINNKYERFNEKIKEYFSI